MEGKISYINHEKQYAVVEFMDGNKKKTAKANIDIAIQKEQKNKKQITKVHQFTVGDVVEFRHTLSPRGDRMLATNLKFKYNSGLDVLLNKANNLSNDFKGYIKEVDGKLFVKEIESYLFIPLLISPWQLKPGEEEMTNPVNFYLINTEKKKPKARLRSEKFIPAYFSAKRAMEKKEVVDAMITRVTANGIYIEMFDGRLTAKIPAGKKIDVTQSGSNAGDKLQILITYIGDERIIVEPVV